MNGLAEVLEDPESCIFAASEGDEMCSESSDDVPESQKVRLSHEVESQRQKLQDLLVQNEDLFAKRICDDKYKLNTHFDKNFGGYQL